MNPETEALVAGLDAVDKASQPKMYTCVYFDLDAGYPENSIEYHTRPFPRKSGYVLVAAFEGMHEDVSHL